MTPETRYARCGDANIAYQVLGEGPDLLYVPGFVSHVEWSWEFPPVARFLERLASFSRLIVLDKRGTGLSDPVVGMPSAEERADDLLAVLDDARSERATVCGTFDGGTLALLLAARFPERVGALALYATPAKLTQDVSYLHGWSPAAIELYLTASEGTWGSSRSADVLAPSLAGDEAYQRWCTRLVRTAASPGMAIALLRMNAELDARPVLDRVTMPAVVLHRSGDAFVDVGHSRALAARLPVASLVELDGCDHWPWAGDADAVTGAVRELVTGERGTADAERVLVTLLLTDVVGSTELAAELGDRRWSELLQDHHAVVRREIARYGGREVDTAGDGFFARFTGPTQAIRCAAAIRDATAELGITLRAGVHTGECELRGERLHGIHVHLAARVASEARAGEILVSRVVRELLDGSGIALEEHGAASPKGFAEPQRLFRASMASQVVRNDPVTAEP